MCIGIIKKKLWTSLDFSSKYSFRVQVLIEYTLEDLSFHPEGFDATRADCYQRNTKAKNLICDVIQLG
jgi:hypothetical protein